MEVSNATFRFEKMMIFLNKQTKKEQRVLVSSSPHADAKTFPFI